MKKELFTRSFFIALISLFLSLNASATTHMVDVSEFQFSPAALSSVMVGDTITWTWVNGSHTTTSTSVPNGAAMWDEPITSTATSYSYVVTVAGAYSYHCTPHSGMMTGTFTATAATGVPVISEAKSAFNIYPNPNAGNFALSLTGMKGESAEMVITNAMGQVVESRNLQLTGEQQISLADYGLGSGVYFIQVKTEDGIKVKRVLVN